METGPPSQFEAGVIGGDQMFLSKLRAALACALVMIALTSASRAVAQPATPEMFGALPNVSEVAISPDGKSVAMLQAAGNAAAVMFYEIGNPDAKPQGVNLGEVKGRKLVWADNDHLLLLVSDASRIKTSGGLRTMEFWRWVSVSRSKSKAVVLIGNEPGLYMPSSGNLMSVLPYEPNRVLLARWTLGNYAAGSSSNAGYWLMSVDLDSGKPKAVETSEEGTIDWVVSAGGEPIARVDFDAKTRLQEFYVRRAPKKYEKTFSERELAGKEFEFGVYGLAEAPGKIVATTYGGRDKRSLVELDMNTGAASRTLFSSEQFDLGSVEYDFRKAAATGVNYIDDLPRRFHLDPADQKLQDSLAKALPGAAPVIESRSADGSRLIVRVVYTDHPDQFFIYDRATKNLALLAPSYNALDGKVRAAKRKFDYSSSDGYLIRGYITEPAGVTARNMPLIVLPHGGPEGRDDQSFDWWSSFYAARGYLVYQPNFRGSDGYGYKFRAAGYGEWGRKMQDDITEGVEKLIADGKVDPARVCIAGGSYGGYAALAGATLTPDLYACAVSVNGVSNILGMANLSARSSDLAEDYWEVRIGLRTRDAASLKAINPVDIADKAKSPILLIHGAEDTVVPIGQSRQMRDALKAAKKTVEYVELAGEDHWLSRGASRTEMLRASIEFIDRHIGAK